MIATAERMSTATEVLQFLIAGILHLPPIKISTARFKTAVYENRFEDVDYEFVCHGQDDYGTKHIPALTCYVCCCTPSPI